MKKEQSLQHLIVTEMPYELFKLLIEEKALSAFFNALLIIACIAIVLVVIVGYISLWREIRRDDSQSKRESQYP